MFSPRLIVLWRTHIICCNHYQWELSPSWLLKYRWDTRIYIRNGLTLEACLFKSRWRNVIQCVLKVDSKQDVTWWLDRVKIARKGLRGTKWRWRASDGLATEGPWLGWGRENLHRVDVLIKLYIQSYVDVEYQIIVEVLGKMSCGWKA